MKNTDLEIAFESDRLNMRPTHICDADFICELLNMPKWHQFIGDRKVNNSDDAKKYIETRMNPQLKRLGFGNFTVIRKSDSAKIGTVGLYDREGLEGLDIGFAFLPDYENKGFAFEASTALINYIADNFDLNVINAITDKQNFASQKLLEKLGLEFIKNVILPDETEEVMFYSNRNGKG